jgi:superfamily I DNA/RNA helicase
LGKATKNVKVHPKLSTIIREDAKILLKKDIDFDYLFHNREDENEDIEFYKKRKNYYEYYGHSDIIFGLVKFLEKDKTKVPTYDHVLVDEFQDFNKLEITLIDLLSEKSPVLIAGDDDQALYDDLKSASAKHIRERFGENCKEYESFTLPHCRRCTRVIVEAVNDIVSNASKNGAVKGRISKKYEYFDHKEKDVESDENSKIIYSQQFAKKIPWFIEKQLGEIANDVKGKFGVLIIAPSKTQCRLLAEGLKKKGFSNIDWSEKSDDDREATLLDGLKILLEDENSNLGWRIVSRFYLSEKDFAVALNDSNAEKPKTFSEIIDSSKKKEVEGALKTLRLVKNGKKIKEEKLDEVLRKVGFNPYDIAKENLKEEIETGAQRVGNPGLRKTQIKITTVESSKGLDADYVFITYFDDTYFIKDRDKTKISDKDICKFLVALTRARCKAFLISSNDKKKPTFLNWINSDKIETI